MAYSVEALMRTMPQVGERLKKKPHRLKNDDRGPIIPRPCTVVYVHPEHLWYTVRFDSGMMECYKVPEIQVGLNGAIPR